MLVDFHLSFGAMLFWLMVGHAWADYSLQSDFIAQAKNHTTDLGKLFWPYVLPAHAFVHAGFVALFTGSVTLGMYECVIHAVTDRLKCAGKLSLFQDQAIHVVCKLAFAAVAVFLWRT